MTKSKKAKKGGTNIEGIQAESIKAEVMAVGRKAKAIQYRQAGKGAELDALAALVEQLNQALSKVPEAQQADAEVVAELAQEVVDKSQEENPNPRILEIKGENLKKAAENLAGIMPTVLSIAGQIVAHVTGMVR